MAWDENDIWINIKDVVYDTANSNISFLYKTKEDRISECRICSHFHFTSNSKKRWLDECSYGQCFYPPDTYEDWIELAECIKDKEWLWTKRRGSDDIDHEAGAVDCDTKNNILNKMRNL